MKPIVTTSPQQLTATEGKRYEINCTARGFPKPRLEWKRLKGALPASADTRPDGKLVFSNIKIEDGGYYTCVAENSAGRSEASTIIVVEGKYI